MKNTPLIRVPKLALDKVLTQYPNRVEYMQPSANGLVVSVYRLKDSKKIIGVLGVESGKVISCKIAKTFL